MRVGKHWSGGCGISIFEDMTSHVGFEEHSSPDCCCSDTNFRDATVQKGRTAFGPAQAGADEAPSWTFCKGHLLVKSPASPRESMWSHAETGWFTLICCYSLVLSALDAACLTASAFLVSTSPLGCCSNAGDLIYLVLSICDIKNAATRILAQDLRNVIWLAETCPELRAVMSQDLSSVLFAAEIFVCYSMFLGGVSVQKVVLKRTVSQGCC